jgi:hypothetical protein
MWRRIISIFPPARVNKSRSNESGERIDPSSWVVVLDHDPLDFIERNLVAGAVVELSRLRGFVSGDLLGMLDGAAVLQIGSDAGGPEGMATDHFGQRDREKDRRFNAQTPMSVLPVSAASSAFIPLDRSRNRDHQGKRFCIVENR